MNTCELQQLHKMNKEEIRDCMLTFGSCWTNPPKTSISDKYGWENTPTGVHKPDMDDRSGLNFGRYY
jgi:hypothetical protein